LRPFSEQEAQKYIQHRMEVAGQRQPIFTKLAMRTAYRLSGGVPRLLNTICARALLGAYATGQTRVKDAVVRRAAREVLGRRRGHRWAVATAAAAALLMVAGGAALLASGRFPSVGAWLLPPAGAHAPPPAPAPGRAAGGGGGAGRVATRPGRSRRSPRSSAIRR